MRKFLAAIVFAALLVPAAVWAQQSAGNTGDDMMDQPGAMMMGPGGCGMGMTGGGWMRGRGMYGAGCGMMNPGMCGPGCGMAEPGWCGMGRRGGMMMGRGMGMMGPLWMLDLSADQQKKVEAIHRDLRKEHWALKGKMMDEREKMRDLYTEDKLDAKKIGAVYDAMAGLRKQMIMTKVDAMNKVRGLLTKEQLEELKKLRSGRGRGMRHRRMREMMDN